MKTSRGYRKRVKHYQGEGRCHELTFSCYQHQPLLTNDSWRQMLSQSIDCATQRHEFLLLAFVFMPEHVHLLVQPVGASPRVEGLLKAIKQPFSFRVKRLLLDSKSPLLDRLTVQERPGKMAFRFWQEGPGYDRNLLTPEAVRDSMEYIHMNPVRRGLAIQAVAWRWSSARYYIEDRGVQDLALPRIHSLPVEFWNS